MGMAQTGRPITAVIEKAASAPSLFRYSAYSSKLVTFHCPSINSVKITVLRTVFEKLVPLRVS